mgnify:CR=1 FL=1
MGLISFKNNSSYLKAIRAHQWIKNILVFVPLLAPYQFTNQNLIESLIAFISFCLIASSMYIANDLFDIEADKAHPKKKLRPFAAGDITIKNGIIISSIMFIFGIIIASSINISFFATILIYSFLAFSYSIFFKKKIIIDICILGSLYTLRIIAGGFAAEIQISFWLLAFSIFLFLSLAAVKRLAELVDIKKRKKFKIAGRGYNKDDLSIISMIAVSAGFISILIVGLYINSPQILTIYYNTWTVWIACCILLYWLIRIIFVAYRGDIDDDPITYALKDNVSRISLIVIILLIMLNFKL